MRNPGRPSGLLPALPLATGSALAGGPALVVDVDSGKVLHAERATDPWFPASITKLMTTYVALDQVRTIVPASRPLLTVSDGAAALPPSKMGFKPGTQLRLDNALKILMVKSANDVAATIAENLGGSIDGFADLMNQQAAAPRNARQPFRQSRMACRTSATRRPPATWRSSPGR